MIGLVNKLKTEFEKNVFPSPEEGELWLESFLKRVTHLFFILLEDFHFCSDDNCEEEETGEG